LQVVAISGEDKATLSAFAKRKGATFPLLTDPTGEVSTIYQADSVPLNYFIDSKGRAVEAVLGYDPEGGAEHMEGLAEALVQDMKS
jgi:peroxiredoxin